MRVIGDSKEALERRVAQLEAGATRRADAPPYSDATRRDSSVPGKLELPPDLEWARGPFESVTKQLASDVERQTGSLRGGLAKMTETVFKLHMTSLWPEWNSEVNEKVVMNEISRDPSLIF